MNNRGLKIIFSIYFGLTSLVIISLLFLVTKVNTSVYISNEIITLTNNFDNSSNADSSNNSISNSNRANLGLNEWKISNISSSQESKNSDQFKEAIVSIDVDDGWLSAYNNGFPIFDKYQFKVTDYIITGDSNTKAGYINYDQIKNLYKRGHNVQSHTVSHPFLTKLSQTKAESEIKDSASQLEIVLGTKTQVLATPYCDNNAFIKETAKKYYQLMRNCDQTVNNTKKNLDPYNLKAKAVLNSTSLEQYKTWINEAIDKKEWIILMYHRVGENNNQYSVDASTLEEQMKFLANKKIKVMPTLDAYNYLIK